MIFGEPPIDSVELADLVIDQIRKCGIGNKQAWTAAIKDGLGELGKSLRYRVSPDRFQGEHLLDLIWRLQPPRCDIVLAVESEWGDYNKNVLEDFEKLMQIKSPLKLLLSRLPKNRTGSKGFTRLLEQIRNIYLIPFQQHICGETYLFVNFLGLSGNVECYQFVAPRDGKIETASITPLWLAKGATP